MLSDSKKRKMYDAGLYDPDDEVDEVCYDSVEFSLIPVLLCLFYEL